MNIHDQLCLRARGVPQTELAKASGVTQKSISMILANKQVPKLETIDKLNKALDDMGVKRVGG